MKIPTNTTFLPTCAKHNMALRGELRVCHPNAQATAVWEFDLTDMWCSAEPEATRTCTDEWEVRA